MALKTAALIAFAITLHLASTKAYNKRKGEYQTRA